MKRALLYLLIPFSLLFLLSLKDKDKMLLVHTAIEKSIALIPNDSIYIITGYDTLKSRKNTIEPRTATIRLSSFYISKYEVSNLQYLEYLWDLGQKGRTGEYYKALPDTLVWREKLSFCEPYIDYYFRHPAYRNYPVVGITHEQAESFCKWLTEKYNSEPRRKFKNALFRLPTKYEWIAAAKGGSIHAEFPWGTNEMQNKEGRYMANFRIIPQANICLDPANKITLADNRVRLPDDMPDHFGDAYILAPVNAYFPNKYGLYNMSGNVKEYVQETGITKGGSWTDTGYYLRISVEQEYDSTNAPSSQIGFRFVMELK